MRINLTAGLFTLLALLVTVVRAHAVEAWTDPTLPVKAGLALWLDAGREEKSRKSQADDKIEPVKDGPAVVNKVDGTIWHDGSGFGRHARQENSSAQPEFRTYWPVSVFSFDGKASRLVVRAPDWSPREATVIVMARALHNDGGRRTLLSSGAPDRAGVELTAGGFVEFGPKVCLTLLSGVGAEGVRLYVNGYAMPGRERAPQSTLALDGLTLGARAGEAAGASTFFAGDIFEVLVYDRVLSDAERSAVEKYLEVKYAGYVYVAPAKAAAASGGVALVTVTDPPAVQPLLPGFIARKLPVQLTNINALRYRADGRLYAGAYNGKIYLLSDTDGDGIEDKADVFWDHPDINLILAIAPTPPNYPRGEGLFVIARGRVVLILDKDRDGRGDELITVAEGWERPRVMGGGIADAMGLVVAPDGRVFFGLGTSDFTNAYLLDRTTGQAGYRLDGERGTIQEVSADFKTRTTVATGLRFTYGLAFNRDGELFATDQEGATWLPNGNPFDELLHIQRGRHYGFPARHPQHLPGVVDEPSTFDYSPQHQCTCGLAFNEPFAPGAPSFGPGWWAGDALVAGESRGRIFRTKLIATSTGYVAKNEIVASTTGLAIDVAVSLRGALVFSSHSGRPDWGSGPQGMGELWQIAATAAPRPALAWSASPTELRVAFDQPLPSGVLAALRGKISVTQGRYVEAGDRFTTVRPGYQVVKNQMTAARFPVTVRDVALADAGRTLVIATTPRTAAVNYGLTLGASLVTVSAPASPYDGQTDLATDLNGLEAEWKSPAGAEMKAWLPHLDFTVARTLTALGGAQDAFWQQTREPGTLVLRGQLDLGDLLQPVVQAGSKLDWVPPAEEVTVVLAARSPFTFTLGGATVNSTPAGDRHVASQTLTTATGQWRSFAVTLTTGSVDPALTASWFTAKSATPRAFPLRRFFVPYARLEEQAAMSHNEQAPQLAGGNWVEGRKLFYGEAACFACHAVRGEGAHVGPDLTNLVFRDYESVLRDIREPNATINPEHVGYTIRRKDGSEITSVIAKESATTITLALAGGASLEISRSDIAEMKPLATSLMPPGLDAGLKPAQLRDLMTFLLVPPLEAAPVVLPNPPPPRDRAEFSAALQAIPAPLPTEKIKPLRIVLCAAEKDAAHARAGLHDYPLWRERWSQLLGLASGVTVEPADRWPSPEQWASADVVALYHNNPDWTAAKAHDLDAFLARGGGLVILHWSVNGGGAPAELAARIGLAWGTKASKVRAGATPLRFQPHAITAGFPLDRPVAFTDETYAQLLGDLAGWTVLATSDEPGGPAPQVWLGERGAGRVFVCIPGHSTWTHDDPLYRLLVFRGLLWTAREPLGRFNDLAPLGVTISP